MYNIWYYLFVPDSIRQYPRCSWLPLHPVTKLRLLSGIRCGGLAVFYGSAVDLHGSSCFVHVRLHIHAWNTSILNQARQDSGKNISLTFLIFLYFIDENVMVCSLGTLWECLKGFKLTMIISLLTVYCSNGVFTQKKYTKFSGKSFRCMFLFRFFLFPAVNRRSQTGLLR